MEIYRDAECMDELDCREVRERHCEYVDGRLEPAVAARVQAHLDECAACSRYDAAVRRSVSLVHGLEEIEPSEDFELRLQHRLFHVQDEASLGGQRAWTGVGAAAMVAGAIALLAWSPLLVMERGAAPDRALLTEGSPAAQPATLATETRGYGGWTNDDGDRSTLDVLWAQHASSLLDAAVSLTGPLYAVGGSAEPWPAGAGTAALTVSAPAHAAFPGPYSPLIVSPPVHGGAVRTISAEYRP